MLIVSIDGGLGNQMFEYIFYLTLQRQYPESQCFLDLSLLKAGVHNGYELERIFGIRAAMADPQDVEKYSEYCPEQIPGSRLINCGNKIRKHLLGRKKSYLVQKDSTVYDESYYQLDQRQSFYFRGVWANVEYCRKLGRIQQVFRFSDIADERNSGWKKKIEETNAVSIHYRKGDYEAFGFQVLESSYYKRAMQEIEKRVEEPVYYVFSDDPEAARKVIGESSGVYYVEGNVGENAYRDMQLMSLCRHHIIANSTFSFWGAYLNEDPHKIVIYPEIPIAGCANPYADRDWIGI